ncbi:hypothetical protein B0T22DRAFT_477445 [Podospora appendiculata]|uniref:NB-ARC domain-containing protein n=1 Tax=Podospora appendiculata TaxID=314037 RepID=A0AAE0XJT5_9PEZI|nr:hypothetical protein B0T22DRAFT_477445 [Podospora appendiculata]
MLGRLRMSTAEALAEYDAFAQKIFSFRNRRLSLSAKFGAAALEVAVRNIVQSRGANPLMRDPKENYATGKTFVCAVTAKNQTAPRRFRGYVLDDELDLDYDKDWDKDCMIWQAARATTAAPGFFKSVSILSGSVKEEFLDAAMGYNNPIGEVLDEAGKIIDSSCKIGCVLSLGTGTREKGLNESCCDLSWCIKVICLMKNITTDSERMHDMAKNRFTDFSSTYFRFSVPEAAAKVKLGQYKKMDGLKKTTLEYLGSSVKSDIDKVINVLSNGSTEGLTIGEACCPQPQASRREAGVSSKFFTGRADILRKMSVFFKKRESGKGPRREFLLHGMGGVGKTQIALKFRQMMDSEDRFEHIFWIDSTSTATIEESYNGIAAKLFADEEGADKRMLHVLKWMDAAREDWMLVMDNCADDDMARFLPEKDKGNIIYTSRFTNMRQALPPDAIAEVNEMEERDAVTLLLRAAGEGANSRSVGLRNNGLPIVKELGCLPLAIDQAGAYVREAWPPCSLQDYLVKFRKERARMLKNGGGHYQGASRQNQAVYATFELSHKALQAIAKGKKGLAMAEAARMAIKILSAICFYHNEGILEEMVERAAENRHECDLREHNPLQSGRLSLEDLLDVDQNHTWDPRKFRSGASLLESLSLVKRDWNSLSMHVLVHSWARDRMKDADRAFFSKSARTLMYHSIPFLNTPTCVLFRRRMLPHVVVCDEVVQVRDDDEIEESSFEMRMALVASDAGWWDESIRMWKSAIRSQQLELTLDHRATLDTMVKLSEVYKSMGRWVEANNLLLEIVERRRHDLGDLHPRTHLAWNALVQLHIRIGNVKEALEVLETMLEVGAANPDLDMESVRSIMLDCQKRIAIAECMNHNGPITAPLCKSEARKREENLWTEYEKSAFAYGEDTNETLDIMSKLVMAVLEQSRGHCAEIIAKEALRRCEARFGPDHHRTAELLGHLALAYTGQLNCEQAVYWQEQSVRRLISCVGTENLDTTVATQLLNEWTILRDRHRALRKSVNKTRAWLISQGGQAKADDLGECLNMLRRGCCDGIYGHFWLYQRLGIQQPQAVEEAVEEESLILMGKQICSEITVE